MPRWSETRNPLAIATLSKKVQQQAGERRDPFAAG
jgi:hypothetical protein